VAGEPRVHLQHFLLSWDLIVPGGKFELAAKFNRDGFGIEIEGTKPYGTL
jgi:hypothetical protein